MKKILAIVLFFVAIISAQVQHTTLIHTNSYSNAQVVPNIELWGDLYYYNDIAFIDSSKTKISVYNTTSGKTTSISFPQLAVANLHIQSVYVYKNFFQKDDTYSVAVTLFSDDGYSLRIYNNDEFRLVYQCKYFPNIVVADGKLLIIDGNKIQMVRNDVLPPSSVTAFIPFKANQKINVATKKKKECTQFLVNKFQKKNLIL